MDLPNGTVTFLFTDIESSTQHWERQPEAMALVLAHHDALLRTAIETHGGTVFKTGGDAFCSAFRTAPQALEAAVYAQLNLRHIPETTGTRLHLKVRMALHTGAAEHREGDYFGATLNRVARLLAIGHGGQILLTEAARALMRDLLPPSAGLISLGEHRLRDLDRSESVFQLCHPELPSEFPPLTSLENPELSNNLPNQVTSFVGRDRETAEIKNLLSRTRLLALVGSGGCGKTRLCLHVAADVLAEYPDGVWLVGLAPLNDPSLVPQSVAQALCISEEPGKALTQTLAKALKSKRMLLVLDNCEHVLAACALLVDTLIRSCPGVKILGSSRESLNIAGEITYRVPSLSFPARDQNISLKTIGQFEAALLFADRAQFHQPEFALTDDNAPAVGMLCRQLDGIPFAIELAAARVRTLSVEEINGKLDNRFRLLTGGSRTAVPRQQTLRAMIDWSYDLLNSQEKLLLGRLAVFVGGWTLEAAEQIGVGEGIEAWEILELLTSLGDKSLVVMEPQAGQTRYRLLETVRQYGMDRLVECGEADAVRERHQMFFAGFAESAEPMLRGPEQAVWLNKLERDHDNLRAVLEHGVQGEAGLRTVEALWRFWYVRGFYTEGRDRLAGVLARADAQGRTLLRAKALNGAGALACSQGDFASAHLLHRESLALFRELDDRQGIAVSLTHLGNAAGYQGDNMAARAWIEEGIPLLRALGDSRGLAYALVRQGQIAFDEGDDMGARTSLEESLALFREFGNNQGIASSLTLLVMISHNQGNYLAARTLAAASIALQREIGDRRGIAYSLEAFAALASVHGQRERGARLWGAAHALRDTLSAPLPPAEKSRNDRLLAQSHALMREDVFAAAWSEGHSLPLAQAIDLALENHAC